MRKKRDGVPLIGGSSLLVIFAVLCLTVFAMLTLSTVEAGGRLSRKSADAVVNYYTADAQAEEIVAALRAGDVPDTVKREDGLYHFSVPISDGQELQVTLEPQDDPNDFAILQWQAVATDDWTPDTDLEVWDGLSAS